jgi:hypothetical protein
MKLHLLFALTTGAVLTGCATQPIAPEKASAVAPTHVTAKHLAVRRPGTCELLVVRDVGLSGSGVAAELFVDKSAVATLKPGEKLTLWLTPGVHNFGVLPKFNLFGMTAPREFDYEIKETRRNSIRIGVAEDGPIFVPTSY